jgi:signal transduction histidine kinase
MKRWSSISSSSSFLESVQLKQIILPSIFLSFVVIIIIFVSSNDWMVSDVDHFYFEMFAVLLSTIIAFYCIARAYLLQEKFSLFVGMGFATVSVVDLLHAVFSYNAAGNSVFLDYFIPQTWFAGRTFLGVMLAIAVIKYAAPQPQQQPPPAAAGVAAAKEKGKRSKKEKEESTAISSSTNKLIHNNDDAGQYYYTDHKYGSFSPSSNQEQEEEQRQSTIDDGGSSSSHNVGLQKILLFSLLLFSTLAISIVAVSFFTYFPGIRLADFPIHRPYEIPAIVLFLIALFYFYKKKLYRANDAFYKGILGALIIDIFGQIVMSYSATNFHTAHNLAHILKDAGYFIIIISLAISSIQYNKLARDKENIIRLQYAKLREADKMKDDFINIAAHELRTPIQPILGLTNLLRSRITDDDYNSNNDDVVVVEQRQFLDVIIRNAKRLQRLTENILDVTKIESSFFTLRRERFDLNDVIINTIDDVIVGTDVLKKQEKVRISYHPKQILVYADKSRLAQVIANLIGNSVKFTTEGTISITAEESNSNDRGEIIICVQDTGRGIDPDILPALFSKFVSNSSSGGTGLGLFISKKIVEAHGGRIWAENNSDGKKGATFTFTLPITNSHHYMNNNNECELL